MMSLDRVFNSKDRRGVTRRLHEGASVENSIKRTPMMGLVERSMSTKGGGGDHDND